MRVLISAIGYSPYAESLRMCRMVNAVPSTQLAISAVAEMKRNVLGMQTLLPTTVNFRGKSGSIVLTT